MHSRGRVYARIWSSNEDSVSAVSDDYGQTFKLLGKQVGRVVEARADSSVLYCTLPSRSLLGVSKDGGTSWIPMEGSSEFWQPLYHNSGYIRSWKDSPDDKEYLPLSLIDQIESDPAHADWIYVLTDKGLYFSRDAGRSFRLASLAQGRLKAIDRIAVDPMDGSYIYAVVDLGQFYRSSDHGCSWLQMKLPGVSGEKLPGIKN